MAEQGKESLLFSSQYIDSIAKDIRHREFNRVRKPVVIKTTIIGLILLLSCIVLFGLGHRDNSLWENLPFTLLLMGVGWKIFLWEVSIFRIMHKPAVEINFKTGGKLVAIRDYCASTPVMWEQIVINLALFQTAGLFFMNKNVVFYAQSNPGFLLLFILVVSSCIYSIIKELKNPHNEKLTVTAKIHPANQVGNSQSANA